ncbi:MAG: hypothetical protein ACFFAF_09495 [Candidatus Hermodarchaeota archaeon]
MKDWLFCLILEFKVVEIRKYYCKKCKRYHYRGKIYKEHRQHRKIRNKSTSYLKNGIINFNFEELRPITQRQVLTLIKKMKETNNKEMYIEQLNRVIQHENKSY